LTGGGRDKRPKKTEAQQVYKGFATSINKPGSWCDQAKFWVDKEANAQKRQ